MTSTIPRTHSDSDWWITPELGRPLFVGDILRLETLAPHERADFAIIIGPAHITARILLAPLRLLSAQTDVSSNAVRDGRYRSSWIYLPDWHQPPGSPWYADLDRLLSLDPVGAAGRDRVASANSQTWISLTHSVSLHLFGIGIDGNKLLLERAIEWGATGG
jgi:hypothetical protein